MVACSPLTQAAAAFLTFTANSTLQWTTAATAPSNGTAQSWYFQPSASHSEMTEEKQTKNTSVVSLQDDILEVKHGH